MNIPSLRIPILICDDDAFTHHMFRKVLNAQFECHSAYNGEEGLEQLMRHPIQLVLLNVKSGIESEGFVYIRKFLDIAPELSVVVCSRSQDFDHVVQAMRLGASDYFVKGGASEEVLSCVQRGLEKKSSLKIQEQQNELAEPSRELYPMIGESKQMRALKKLIAKIRSSNFNIHIVGETGTGKELVARKLRDIDGKQSSPFIAIDAATIQSSTAESNLFGHEKGAFTGADRTKKGIFEEADGGTVYFDEIANMPLAIQIKLLRVLQEKEVVRLGATRAIPIDFRLISATNKNLEELVKRGEFAEDLLHRVNVIPIYLPPLRERVEDIPLLIEFFLQKYSSPLQPHLSFTQEAIELLKAYPWPGNIRELGNAIALITTITETDEILASDLPPRFRKGKDDAAGSTFYAQVAKFEKKLLEKEFIKHGGKVSKIAESLVMDRSHLYRKLRTYEICLNELECVS